jgi:hypothetical protein
MAIRQLHCLFFRTDLALPLLLVSDDLETVGYAVLLYRQRLILQRILLMFGGHAKVLSSRNGLCGHGVLLTSPSVALLET